MKLLYVLRYYPALSETFIARELAELCRRGMDVTVARIGIRADSALAEPLPQVKLWAPSRMDRVAAWLVPPSDDPLRRRSFARAHALGLWCRRAGVERVHAHFVGEASAWARIAADVAGIPFGVTAHAVDLYKPFPTARAHLVAARPALAISEAGASHAAERFGVRPRVVRCGVPVPPRPVRAPPSDRLRVVSVARWVPKKGLDLLVGVVRSRTDVDLRIVGDAPASIACGQVRVGPLPPNRVLAELARNDVFVLPCRVAADGDRDGIPVSLMEAMASGLPVITTRVGGIPELVDDSVGWLIPPDDPAALDDALSAARDPAERERRGAAARARIEQDGWTVRRQVDELVAAWSGT
ncbi:MAG: colanic acid/amylovoran biosynthesis glycosyltransferase [Myxococcota bacterium]|jgi:colanic acid/amylovoran biosynthesis glycosyltransferase